MPANNHLQFFEISDFSGGLVAQQRDGGVENISMPNKTFAKLVNYEPIPEGGLRSFFDVSKTLSQTGINDPTNEVATGIWARDGAPFRSGFAADGTDILLATVNGVTAKSNLYRMDGSNGETTWKQATGYAGTSMTTASTRATEFSYMKDTSGVEWYLLVFRPNGGSLQGYYVMERIDGAGPPAGDGALTSVQSGFTGPLAVSQARAMVGGGNDEKLWYSPVGNPLIGNTTNFVSIAPNQILPNLAGIVAYEPDDLLVMKEGAPWVEISGDLTVATTSFREMGDSYHGRFTEQRLAKTPDGIAFIEPGGSIYITDGHTFTNLSALLPRMLEKVTLSTTANGADVVSPGQLTFLNNYLFAPQGYVYNHATKSWFQTPQDIGFAHADPYGGIVYATTRGVNFTVKLWSLFEGDNSIARAATGMMQTAPFSNPAGRGISVREVQVFCQCFGDTTMQVDLVSSTDTILDTRTVTGLTGRQMADFLFPNVQDEHISIRVTATQTGGGEAPTIDRFRVGFDPGNLLK